jgi:hypothetical protein
MRLLEIPLRLLELQRAAGGPTITLTIVVFESALARGSAARVGGTQSHSRFNSNKQHTG